MKIGLISIVLVMALAGGIGYIVKANTVSNNADSQKTDSTTKDDSKIMDEDLILITKEQAQEIALKNVTNGQIVEVSYDGDDYIPHYEVTVQDNLYEYEFKIDLEDGSILETNKKSRSAINNIEVQIDEVAAKNIVLAQVPQGDILRISLEYEDNIPTYEIKATDGAYEYEFEINANDGTIINEEKEMLDL